MLLFLLAYLGGVLTIVSPCILPVLPFVFARADRPFLRSGLPMLAGMVVAFAAVASLAAVAGGWVVAANQYGRAVAIVLLALFGLALLFPGLAERATRPLVALGVRMSESVAGERTSLLSSALLGVATGLLWAPCAGPILGLILTGAAIHGANAETTFLLFTFAAGAATSLAAALLIGGRLFAAMKRSLGVGEWIRRALGAAVLAGVVAIALGLDTGVLTRLSTESTAAIEQGLLDRLHPAPSVVMNGGPGMMSGSPTMMGPGPGTAMQGRPATGTDALPVEGELPPLNGAVEWLNSPPLTQAGLRGKVVLIDFWTYSCINCLRAIPYVRAWAEKYKDRGLVVIGVHTPEFAFEKDVGNVRRAVSALKIEYPVAVDSNYAIWGAFNNQYWPAHYFIDAEGRIRHHHFGEGEYAESERVIQQLLVEAGRTDVTGDVVAVNASGAEAAPDLDSVRSPETYIGYDLARNFQSSGGVVKDAPSDYAAGALRLNQWGLSGNWTVHAEQATLDKAGGSIAFRFHARDLHLVLGPADDGKPIRFRVTIDGAPAGASHGADVAPDGSGIVTEYRLYQLVRQSEPIADHTFSIEFLDPGIRAFAFTFG